MKLRKFFGFLKATATPHPCDYGTLVGIMAWRSRPTVQTHGGSKQFLF